MIENEDLRERAEKAEHELMLLRSEATALKDRAERAEANLRVFGVWVQNLKSQLSEDPYKSAKESRRVELEAIAAEEVQRSMVLDLEHDLGAERSARERAEADVKQCQEVYAAARRVVQAWKNDEEGPSFVDTVVRLQKAVGL